MKLPFVFGIHNHQPLGNFDHVIERLTAECYQPFLRLISRERIFRLSLHVSGILLKWWENKSPEVIDLLGRMVHAGQVELVAGGFFEPVLAAIPREDRKEQVLRHKDYLKKLFGVTPVGLWLTERVWEQYLVEDLVDLGIKYVVVDDRHFLVSGFEKEALHGYYLTETEGRRLAVFPIDETLRYAIPFWPVHRLEQYLNDIAFRGGRMAIYFDDGEKFGAWPGTKKWVYDDGWLRAFLEALAKWVENGLIEPMTYAQALEKVPPLGLAYLPTASYMEMEEWSLPARRILEFEELNQRLDTERSRFKAFIRGGHWKNFFVKYSESNYLHKRMFQVSRLSRTKPFDQEARLHLLAAQCNDPYWHGIFGGLYLPHLRQAVWQALLSAEGRLRAKEKAKVEVFDLDYDGQDEVVFHSAKAMLAFKPSYGAHLVEWSDLSSAHNFQNTLTRRFEAYHVAIKQAVSSHQTSIDADSGVFSIHHLKKRPSPEVLAALVYDWYERHSLIEHFFDPWRGLSDFVVCNFGEWGDFANQPFVFHRLKNSLLFFRDGGLYPPGSARRPLLLRKIIKIAKGGLSLEVNYEIEYRAEEETRCHFGVEFNFFPPLLAHGQGELLIDGTPFEIEKPFETQGEVLELKDRLAGKTLSLRLREKARFFVFPVKTVSQSEESYDLTTQGLAIMPFWAESFRQAHTLTKSLKLEIL